MRLGIALADRDLPSDSGLAIARAVDASHVDSLWTNETGGADATVTLAAWAAVTTRVTLATGVVPLSARSTATLALATHQLDRLAPQRIVMGIGVGQRGAAERLHEREWRPPLEWTRLAIDVLHGSAPDTPIVIGTLGPKMIALAAREADGALLNWTTADHARVLRESFDASVAAAGRDPGDQILAGYVRVAVGPDAEQALAGQIDFYSGLPFYRDFWQQMGSPAASEVALASTDGRDLVERLAAWDVLDCVVARIVPTPDFGLDRVVDILCETA